MEDGNSEMMAKSKFGVIEEVPNELVNYSTQYNGEYEQGTYACMGERELSPYRPRGYGLMR